MDATALQAEIAESKLILAAITAAIKALADPTVKEYRLDTGQTVTRVERHDLSALLAQRRALMNEICTMEARLTGGGVTRAVPAW